MSSRMRGEKKSLLVPTKSHTKNEKQIREQIQYEVEWENDSDKRRSKLSGFPHSTHSYTDLLLSPILTPYFFFSWDPLFFIIWPHTSKCWAFISITQKSSGKDWEKDEGFKKEYRDFSTHIWQRKCHSGDCGQLSTAFESAEGIIVQASRH